MKRIAVYCGSSHGARPAYRAAAERLGEALVERGLGLVYGGGNVGLMGVVAERVLESGGEVVGVIPRQLYDLEVAHVGVTHLHVVESMHGRKLLMTELSDAFIALPGGLGTMDELFEALTWRQLRIHGHPVGLLNVEGYFDPLIELLDRFRDEGFVSPANRDLLVSDDDVLRLLDRLAQNAAVRSDFPERGRRVLGPTLLHVTTAAEWEAAVREGVYRGDTLSTEGFLHASEPAQVIEVANRLFRGRTGLVLLLIDERRVRAPVVRENLEGGTERYPHLYGPLNLDAVRAVLPFRPAADGTFTLPPGVE